MRRLAWLGAVALALTLGAGASAQDFPKPVNNSPVIDAAGLLSPSAEADLEGQLHSLNRRSGRHVVVATVPSLGGLDVKDYANRYFRALGVGDAASDNGVLILLSTSPRKVRIEVGSGLEGDLTDAESDSIVRNGMVPLLKAGDIAGALSTGAGLATAEIDRGSEGVKEDSQRAALAESGARAEPSAMGWLVWIAVLGGIGAVSWKVVDASVVKPRRRRRAREALDAKRQAEQREQEQAAARARQEAEARAAKTQKARPYTPSYGHKASTVTPKSSRPIPIDAGRKQSPKPGSAHLATSAAAAALAAEAALAESRRRDSYSPPSTYDNSSSWSPPPSPPPPDYSSPPDYGGGSSSGGGGDSNW